MSGKNSPRKKATPTTSKSSSKQELGKSNGFAGIGRMTWIIGLVVVLVTGITFSGVTKLQWTNWDDDEYVYENPKVLEGDYKAIFTQPVNNNYNPLPVAMHAWEWKVVKNPAAEAKDPYKALEDKARFFHINNLWLHVLCTALVFILMLQLGLNPIWAGLAALLFGVHPMRVESVAWITERKDVLFGTFYVGALIAYIRYLDTKKWFFFAICMVLFVLSLLSKIQAVSLPLSMLAIDWYRARKFNLGLVLEKIPFLIGSAITGYVGVMYLAQGQTLDTSEFSLLMRIPLGLSSYLLYVVKAIVPYETCTYYPYPKVVGLDHFIGFSLALILIAGGALLYRISREFTFGLAFFTVNIVFLLQIVGAGSAFLADRFTYIAYIGLFFALAMVAQRVAARGKSFKTVVMTVTGASVLVYVVLTWMYVPKWKNSDTLWSDVIAKYKDEVVLPYVNRGQYLRRHGQYLLSQNKPQEAKELMERAFQDFNVAIRKNPKYHLSYLNRGNIYFDRGENDKALADYSQVLKLLGPINLKKRVDPAASGALSNRGAIYSRKGMRKEAIADYDLALKINPKDKNTWSNRAVTRFDMGDYPGAIADFTEFLKYEPNQAGAHNTIGVSKMRLGKWQESIPHFDRAIQLAPNDGAFYGNRAIAKANTGDKAAALVDAQKAQSLKVQLDPAFLQSLQQ